MSGRKVIEGVSPTPPVTGSWKKKPGLNRVKLLI